jgi:hypothetical protein
MLIIQLNILGETNAEKNRIKYRRVSAILEHQRKMAGKIKKIENSKKNDNFFKIFIRSNLSSFIKNSCVIYLNF